MKEGAASCFDGVIFIGKKAYVPHLIEAIGDDYVLTRGAAVGEYIDSMKASKPLGAVPRIVEQSTEVA